MKEKNPETNSEDIMNIFNDYCKKKKLYRHNIRLCDLGPLSELLDIKIVPLEFKETRKKYEIRDRNYDICVVVVDSHYI